MYSKKFNEFLYPKRAKLRKARRELIKALKEEFNYEPITKNEIIDLRIDLELYNKQCTKKRRRK